jgi:CMP/dCMP kinase
MSEKVIAISGQPGAGSTTVGKLLAEKLELKYFSPGQLFKDISKGRITQKHYHPLFEKICEQKNLEIPQIDKSEKDSSAAINVWNSSIGENQSFHSVIDELQLKLAEKGNIVIDGKLSLRMIKSANLKIWFKASLEARVKRTSQREKLELEEAKKIVLKKEEKERRGWNKIYGFDYWEQENDADLVIDTSDLKPEEIVDKIISKLNDAGTRIRT